MGNYVRTLCIIYQSNTSTYSKLVSTIGRWIALLVIELQLVRACGVDNQEIECGLRLHHIFCRGYSHKTSMTSIQPQTQHQKSWISGSLIYNQKLPRRNMHLHNLISSLST